MLSSSFALTDRDPCLKPTTPPASSLAEMVRWMVDNECSIVDPPVEIYFEGRKFGGDKISRGETVLPNFVILCEFDLFSIFN